MLEDQKRRWSSSYTKWSRLYLPWDCAKKTIFLMPFSVEETILQKERLLSFLPCQRMQIQSQRLLQQCLQRPEVIHVSSKVLLAQHTTSERCKIMVSHTYLPQLKISDKDLKISSNIFSFHCLIHQLRTSANTSRLLANGLRPFLLKIIQTES